MINLGDKVRDKISGMSGIATAVCEFLYGCRRIAIQSMELKDGRPVENVYFDEDQVEPLEVDPLQLRPKSAPKLAVTGGPRDDPKRRPDPVR